MFSVYVDNVILTSGAPPQTQAPASPKSKVAPVDNGAQPSTASIAGNPVISNFFPVSAESAPAVVPVATATAYVTANT